MNLTAPTDVYRALQSLCDDEGIVLGVNQATLAKVAGLDVTVVRACLVVLEHDNYVQRRSPSGRYLTSSYRIAPPPLPDEPEQTLHVIRGGAA